MKENFYVFLDIDGVLWDEKFIHFLTESGVRYNKEDDIENHYKPESMEALNLLINTLKKNYDVTLVITSTKRFMLEKTIDILKKNNLTAVEKIDRTQLSIKTDRGKEILNYLKAKPDYKNYCVIDDEPYDIIPYINKEKIIKTSDQNALNKKQVVRFLSKLKELKQNNNVELEQ